MYDQECERLTFVADGSFQTKLCLRDGVLQSVSWKKPGALKRGDEFCVSPRRLRIASGLRLVRCAKQLRRHVQILA